MSGNRCSRVPQSGLCRITGSCEILCCLLFAGILVGNEAFAQSVTLPQKRPSREQPELPEFEPDEIPETLQLPALPKPPPESELSQQVLVYVREFRLTGNTIFSTDELAATTAPYENREITSAELQEVRYALTRYYVNRGYINSGATIPDQQVTDGVINIQIVEGELNEVNIAGNDRLRSGYISKRIVLGAGPPLNIEKLGEKLQILQQNPRIDRINAELAPGARPGKSRLNVDVTEAQHYGLWVGFDNHQPPSVGSYAGNIRGVHRNVTGYGDTAEFEYDKGDGLDEWSISYALPLTARDTTLRLYYDRIDSEVVDSPFDELDIKSKQKTFSASLTQPFYLSVNRTFTLGLSLDLRQSKTFLLGERFAFTTGTDDGKTDLSVIRFSQEWLGRDRSQVLAARSLFSAGIDAFGATVNGEPRDGKYFFWLGQLQWAHRLADSGLQLIFRTDFQYTSDGLPSMEQLTVGGANTVRGYRENRLIADAGIVSSLEFRIPVITDLPGGGQVQLAPFFDYGKVSNREGDDPDPDHISSAGIGLLGTIGERIDFNIYYGYPLEDFDDPNDDLQDKGVHFSLNVRLL